MTTVEGLNSLPDDLPEETRISLQLWPDAGLGLPYIPPEFASRTYPVGEWAWGWKQEHGAGEGLGTEAVVHPFAAYLQSPEYDRFLAGDWRPRFIVCHAGHGTNSYGINYVVVTERIALLSQAGWGGVYQDPDRAASAVNRMRASIAEFLTAAAAAPRWPQGRLLVVESDFRGSRPPSWVAFPGQDPTHIEAVTGTGLAGASAALGWIAADR